MKLGIEGKVALVTGGSQGIGQSVAVQLAAEGAKVALTWRNEPQKAQAVVEQIERAGGQALALKLDLADLGSVKKAVEATLAKWGRLDILVNNAVRWAAQMPAQAPAFESLPISEWMEVLHDNIDGAFTAIQAALPAMKQQKFGRIVNVSSGLAIDGTVGSAPYGAAKAALHGLTSNLMREVGKDGILVNVVIPGLTATDRMVERSSEEMRAKRGEGYPIGRLLPPDEVAPTIVFLCSALNTAVTGEIVRASGGRPG